MRNTRVRFLNRELRRHGVQVVNAPYNLNFVLSEADQVHMTRKGWRRIKRAWNRTPVDKPFSMMAHLLRMKDEDAEKIRRCREPS